MAAKRDLSLSPRKENQREAQPINPPVQFSLDEIKQHFKESMDSVKAQYAVADSLAADGDLSGCKTIWRSQVVLAEGLMDFYIHEMSFISICPEQDAGHPVWRPSLDFIRRI